jgi:hypothetical protein
MTNPQELEQVQDTVQSTETETTTETPIADQVRVEEFKISGHELVEKVKELIHEGNIRRIILKTDDGHTLLEIPLTVGVVGGVLGAVMFPVIAALGAIGAMVARITLVIEKRV